ERRFDRASGPFSSTHPSSTYSRTPAVPSVTSPLTTPEHHQYPFRANPEMRTRSPQNVLRSFRFAAVVSIIRSRMCRGQALRWTHLSRQNSDDSPLLSHQGFVIPPSRRPWRRGSTGGSRVSPALRCGGRASQKIRPRRPPPWPPDNPPRDSSH